MQHSKNCFVTAFEGNNFYDPWGCWNKKKQYHDDVQNEFIVSGAIQFISPCSLIVISQRKRLVLARHKGSFEF